MDTCTPMITAALWTAAKGWEQANVPLTDERINKGGIDIYTTVSFSLKRDEILTHATTWMKLEEIMLRKISQSQNDKYCRIPLIQGT